jgi:hypothetical protein
MTEHTCASCGAPTGQADAGGDRRGAVQPLPQLLTLG